MRCGFWSGPARGSSAFRPLAAVLALVGFGFVYEREASRLAADYEAGTEPDRRNAIRALRGLDGPAVRALLLEAIEDEDSEVRLLAARALVERDVSEVIPLVTPWLDERSEEPRCVAVEALAHFRVVAERARIERMLADPDAEVRERVARALGTMGGSVPALARALDDLDSRVKLAALEALTTSAHGVAPSGAVAGEADTSLALALTGASTRVADATHDADPLVRRAALVTLLAIAPQTAGPTALAALEDADADVLAAALGALGTLHDPAFVARVVPFLDHAEDDVALAAVYALGRFAPNDVARPLASRLGDPRLRAAAERVLARLGRTEHGGSGEAARACIDALAPETARANVRTAAFGALVGCVGVAPRTLPDETERALVALVARDAAAHSAQLLVASPDDDASRVLTELALGAPGSEPPEARAETARAALEALAMHLETTGPDGRVAEPLLASLDAMEPDARVLALRVLGASGAVRIRGALRERHARLPIGAKAERAALVAALGALGDQDSLALFAASAAEESPALELASADALAALGERAFAHVARLASHRSGWARSVAIDVTGRWLADPAFRESSARAEWVRRIERATHDRNPRVVSAAIDAAVNAITDRRAEAEPLVAALTRLAAETGPRARLAADALAYVASPAEFCVPRPASRSFVSADASASASMSGGLPAETRVRVALPDGRSLLATSDARGRLPRRFACAVRLELVEAPRAPSRPSFEGAAP